jgi:hypothetical protein
LWGPAFGVVGLAGIVTKTAFTESLLQNAFQLLTTQIAYFLFIKNN